MPLDTSEIGVVASELMERLANDYEDEADVQVGMVSIIVEVRTPTHTVIEFRSSDDRRWVQTGLFYAALRASEKMYSDDDGE